LCPDEFGLPVEPPEAVVVVVVDEVVDVSVDDVEIVDCVVVSVVEDGVVLDVGRVMTGTVVVM
jgi:hypothetical protein